MSEALMGPTYSVILKWNEIAAGSAVIAALSGTKCRYASELPEPLKERLWKCFTAIVAEHLNGYQVEHDGYAFEWDVSCFDYDPDRTPNEAIVTVGINVLIKEEDFDSFEGLLQDNMFSAAAQAGIKAVVCRYLTAAGVDTKAISILVEEVEFGYG